LVRCQCWIEPIQQQLGDALLFVQQRLSRGLRRVRREDGLYAQGSEQLQHILQGKALPLERGDGILDPSWLRALAVLQEVVAATADPMDPLREIDHLEPGGESTDE